MKKGLLFVMLIIVFTFNLKGEVNAIELNTQSTYDKIDLILNYNDIKPLAEVVQWYYRYEDGRLQKRLWSFTYGYWITDWIWV